MTEYGDHLLGQLYSELLPQLVTPDSDRTDKRAGRPVVLSLQTWSILDRIASHVSSEGLEVDADQIAAFVIEKMVGGIDLEEKQKAPIPFATSTPNFTGSAGYVGYGRFEAVGTAMNSNPKLPVRAWRAALNGTRLLFDDPEISTKDPKALSKQADIKSALRSRSIDIYPVNRNMIPPPTYRNDGKIAPIYQHLAHVAYAFDEPKLGWVQTFRAIDPALVSISIPTGPGIDSRVRDQSLYNFEINVAGLAALMRHAKKAPENLLGFDIQGFGPAVKDLCRQFLQDEGAA